jgi:drug/metabolite transporter (DMT)-like permease
MTGEGIRDFPESHGASRMTTQAGLWTLSGLFLVLAVVAGFAEHRRTRRRNLDRPGWVPWMLIQVLAGIGAVVAFALALKG